MISEYLIKKAAEGPLSQLGRFILKNPYVVTGGVLGLGAGAWAGNQLSKDEEDPEGTWTGRILGGLTGTTLGAIGGNALLRHFNLGIEEKARRAYDNSHDEIAFLGTPE